MRAVSLVLPLLLLSGCPQWLPYDRGDAALGIDAGTPPVDTGIDAFCVAPDVGAMVGVDCNAHLCAPPNVCCLSTTPRTCTSSCASGKQLGCDGPEDCGGARCCWGSPAAPPTYVSACENTSGLGMCDAGPQLCHTDCDCNGASCVPCLTDTGAQTVGFCGGCPTGTSPA